MKFYYQVEKRKFDEEWKRTAKAFEEHGMPPEHIEVMREFDWDAFKSQRKWALHTQEIPNTDEGGGEAGSMDSPMVKRYFDRFTTRYDTYGSHSRYWWIQEISCESVSALLASKNWLEIELLTLSVYEGYTLEEISRILEIPRSTVAWKIGRLLKEIESAFCG